MRFTWGKRACLRALHSECSPLSESPRMLACVNRSQEANAIRRWAAQPYVGHAVGSHQIPHDNDSRNPTPRTWNWQRISHLCLPPSGANRVHSRASDLLLVGTGGLNSGFGHQALQHTKESAFAGLRLWPACDRSAEADECSRIWDSAGNLGSRAATTAMVGTPWSNCIPL